MERRSLERLMASMSAAEAVASSLEKSHRASEEMIESAARAPAYTIAGRTAVVPITGVIFKDLSDFMREVYEFFGIQVCTCRDIRAALSAALGDARADSILLLVDSPGGYIAGTQDLADAIYEARSVKPLRAHIEDLGCSGAYWLACQAGEVSANESAELGSIGVFTVWYDTSEAYEQEGVRAHLIASGPLKGFGDGVPVDEARLSAEQKIIDDYAAVFKAAVARGRGLAPGAVEELATGGTWLAPEAVQMGLIDRVASSDAAVAGATAPISSPQGRKEAEMTEKTQAVAPPKTAAELAALHPELVADIRKEAEAVGHAKGEADKESEMDGRLVTLKALAPDRPEFVLEQFEAGASMEEAQAALKEVELAEAKQERDRLAKENETLRKEAKTAASAGSAGGEPLKRSGDGQGAAPLVVNSREGVEAARAYASEHKCTMREAFSALARKSG
jgi:signal peptide peptidase SppA